MRRRTRDTGIGAMDYLQAKAVVDAIEYKPDWEITLSPVVYDGSPFGRNNVRLEIVFGATDSTDPDHERKTDVLFDVVVDLACVPTPEALLDFVKRTITQAEMHERDEWLRYRGELMDDPHRPGRDGRATIEVA